MISICAIRRTVRLCGGVSVAGLLLLATGASAVAAPAWQAEWDHVKAAAKKEGKVVINIPPDPTLGNKLRDIMKKKFGIQAELVPARGSKAAQRIAEEFKAGVHYFDVAFLSAIDVTPRLRPLGAVDDLHKYWILPAVKDPKNWWGGHIWGDNGKKYLYYPCAYMLDNVWYNASLVKPNEVRSWDDLLNPKWKGRKIGLFDPRLGGAGRGIWGFIWKTKGEGYLTKLAAQQLVLGNRRPLADRLARGELDITIGPTFYTFQQFLRAGLPLKHFATLKEGTYVSVGNGGPTVMSHPPHPNATKVFINWFLSREGQDFYSRVHGQATRRLDVDTKWMAKIGVRAAKDHIKVEDYYRRENQSEKNSQAVRVPALKFAKKLFD